MKAFSKVVTSDRGAVFIETAIVLPLYFILLAFCVDMPRLLAVRQRMYAASRLVAELKARDAEVDTSPDVWGRKITDQDLHQWLMKDISGSSAENLAPVDCDPERQPVIAEMITGVVSPGGSVVEKLGNAIANFVTGGEKSFYVDRVFRNDKFYGARVGAKVKTLLPAAFYRTFMEIPMGSDGEFLIAPPDACYVPSYWPAQEYETANPLSWIGEGFGGLLSWLGLDVPKWESDGEG